jgi:D-2-hydroxyacid dehydrogenase (NADP+)
MSAARQSERPSPQDTKLLIAVWHAFSQWRPPAALARAIGERWPQLQVVHLPDYQGLSEQLADTHIFVGASLRAEQFRRARRLAWIHSTAAGVSQLMYPELRQSGVMVTNPRGIFSVPMAEHTMGLMLALARNFPDAVRYQDRGSWAQQELWDRPQQLSELQGKLLLVVGYGSIGRELAKRARAFGLRVWGVTRSSQGDLGQAERMLPVSRLAEALPHADYLVLAAPETPETRGLIARAELQQMKAGARLINVGRGSLLDESALRNALESGRLAGAALDVASSEPLPPDSPLWKAPNLFITPHTSGVSDRLWQRETELLLDLLAQWFAGEELSNRVDLSRGY